MRHRNKFFWKIYVNAKSTGSYKYVFWGYKGFNLRGIECDIDCLILEEYRMSVLIDRTSIFECFRCIISLVGHYDSEKR